MTMKTLKWNLLLQAEMTPSRLLPANATKQLSYTVLGRVGYKIFIRTTKVAIYHTTNAIM